MATNPNIILATQPVQVAGPLDQYQRLMALKGIQQRNALNDIQLQNAQLQNKEAQQAYNDSQILRQSYMQANGDPDKTLDAAMKAGASPQALLRFKTTIVDAKTKLAALDKDQLANQQSRNNMLAGILAPVAAESDPAKQQALWQQAEQAAINQGLMKPGEAPAYPGPEGVQHLLMSLKTQDQLIKETTANAAKTRADAAQQQAKTTAEKEERLAPGEMADSDTKVQQDAAAQLGAATTKDDYARIWYALPPDVAKKFPHPDKFSASITPKIVRSLGMTADQQTRAGIEQQNANTNAGHLSVDQANLRINQGKFNTEFGPGAVQGWVQQMKQSPDVYQKIPSQLRIAVGQEWNRETGLPVPRDVPVETKNNEVSSIRTIDTINRIRKLLNDPQVQFAMGPILGRMGNLEQGVGDTFFKKGPMAQKEQELRTGLRYLLFQEGKTLLGGRPAEKLIEQLERSSASPEKSKDLIIGALNATEAAAQGNIDAANQYRFGGKGSIQSSGESGSPQVNLGQVVTLRNGKRIKVTSVHADGSFDGQEVR
jgi:hypothetical protein